MFRGFVCGAHSGSAHIHAGIGTLLVLFFSDPMVDVLSSVADRIGVSPFYVAFVLAPVVRTCALAPSNRIDSIESSLDSVY